jgi:predicted phosphodiesterase
MVRVVSISDTHTYHNEISLPDGDILIHAGDFSFKGKESEVRDFGEWIAKQPHQYKCVIAGNHDLSFEQKPAEAIKWLLPSSGVHYLQDTEVSLDVNGRVMRVYGSPYQPEFFSWAFNLPRGALLKAKWDLIPEGLDVLITHGPAYGILDMTDGGGNVGCQDLLEAIQRVKPKIHCAGHIHEAYGMEVMGSTTYINASICNRKYCVDNLPIVVDI